MSLILISGLGNQLLKPWVKPKLLHVGVTVQSAQQRGCRSVDQRKRFFLLVQSHVSQDLDAKHPDILRVEASGLSDVVLCGSPISQTGGKVADEGPRIRVAGILHEKIFCELPAFRIRLSCGDRM